MGLALQVVAIGGDFHASHLNCVVIYQGLGSECWSVGWPVRAQHYSCVFEKAWLVEQFNFPGPQLSEISYIILNVTPVYLLKRLEILESDTPKEQILSYLLDK